MEDGVVVGLNRKVDDLSNQIRHLTYTIDQYVRYGGGKKFNMKSKDPYSQDFSKDENEDRGNWSGRLDFLLACLGYAVGLGNVWRFPYLCYKNGGAVFFIPYVIMLVIVGMPIFFMELSLGQYTSAGPLTCWEMAKLFKGVGFGMVIVSALVGIYYNMIIAWSIYYFFASFTSDLPWQYCHHHFNTPWCADKLNPVNESSCALMGFVLADDGVCYTHNRTMDTNETIPYGIWNQTIALENGKKPSLPSAEYLNYNVLHHNKDGTTNFENLGEIHWQLVLCLLLAWIIVILSLIKGIKSSGKVVYFTALFPYCVLVILFGVGLSLDGSGEGIEWYIAKIKIEKLYDAQVWKEAAVQIFFSLSASWGGLIALSSYNRFHNDCLRDSMIVSLGNCLTSFFAGFVVFSFLGFLAKQQGVGVDDVVDSGVGLAFIVYPAAVTYMPVSPLWAILFFMMLITLGLDSEFALMETVTTSLMDQWPGLRNYKSILITTLGAIFFLLGLTLCTSGGDYMLTVMDSYAGGWNVLIIAICECICISYVYGVVRFRNDIRVMLGPTGCCCFPWNICFPWWMICWSFLTPLGVLFVTIFSWVDYSPLEDGGYVYPEMANELGWCMTMTVIAAIIITPFILFCMAKGSFSETMTWRQTGAKPLSEPVLEYCFGPLGTNFNEIVIEIQRLRYLTTPTEYWGPSLPKHRQMVHHLPDFVIDPHGAGTEAVNADDMKVEYARDNPAYS